MLFIPKRASQVQRFIYLLLCSLLMFILFTGCSSSKSSSQNESALSTSAEAPAAVVAQKSTAIMKDSRSESKAESAETKGLTEQSNTSIKTSTSPIVVPPQGEGGFNRKLIYTANMVLQVQDYAKAQTELRDLVAGSGAYILNFNESTTKTEIGGNYTIKVAASGFVPLLDSIETINKAKQRSVQGLDVTEEYVDLSSRLKAKELVEKRLLNFMEQATKSDDLLAFSQELGKVQEEIEQIKGRMRYLEQNVAFSTIELRIYQLTETKVLSDTDDKSFVTKLKDALQYSLESLVSIVQGVLIIVTVILPYIVILLVLGLPIWYFIRKRKAHNPPKNDDSIDEK